MPRNRETLDDAALVARLKALGGRWDAEESAWRIPATKKRQVRALVTRWKRGGRRGTRRA